MEADEFKEMIKLSNADDFCREQLFSMENWLFDTSADNEIIGNYEQFRAAISEVSGVNPDDIRLVGSARFGFSMSPKPEKRFRAFHDGSDLDVVIVSEGLFAEVWNEFLTAYYNGYTWIKHRHSGDVFRKFLYLPQEERYQTDYLRTAWRRLDGMARQVLLRTGLSRDLKYRLYADWDAAVGYHAYGVRKLQKVLEHVA